MTIRKAIFGELRMPEIAEVLEKPNAIILPLGSTEQHGTHLPVNFDAHSVTCIAEVTAEKINKETDVNVLVAPTICYSEAFGNPPFKKLLPGTIPIQQDTAINLIHDVVYGLVNQGFKNILLLNGHSENIPLIEVALRKVLIEFKDPDIGLCAINSFLMPTNWSDLMQCELTEQEHAGEWEVVVAMVFQEENVKLGKFYEGSHTRALPAKYTTPYRKSDVFFNSRLGGVRDTGLQSKGNLCKASKETGEKAVAAIVEELSEIILSLVESQGVTLEEI